MRGRGRGGEKLTPICNDLYTLSLAVEISDRPKVAVFFKTVIINSGRIEEIVYR
jgi:hypothetical protein